MPQAKGGTKNAKDASLFHDVDPEKVFYDLREIGHGSFGAVYFARHNQTKEVVAIKKMSFTGKNSTEKWQDIVKEVQFFTNLKHENCVRYHGCYLKDHTAWLVMDYCLGSASDIIEVHKKPLIEVEIAAVCHGVLLGLDYLHKINRIHRDIKAGNILLSERGVVKLADFGSASMKAPANSFVGTPYWMSPEVILAMDEGQYDGKVDIWSLGITCIELAERKPPLFDMNAMSALYHIAQNDPPQLSSGEWSDDFRLFVKNCLKKQPADRPSSEELLKEKFITRMRPHNTLLELIDRTKSAVRALDKANYNKLKLIMAETSSDIDDISEDGVKAVAPSSAKVKTNTAKNGALAVDTRVSLEQETKKLSLTSQGSSVSEDSPSEGGDELSDSHNSGDAPITFSMPKPSNENEEGDRFATLRPAQLVARQLHEHQGSEAYREQLQVYKRLRQQHQNLIIQLEQRQQQEMYEHRKALEKEFENQMHAFDKEMEKLKAKHRTELEQKVKHSMGEEKKLVKQTKEQQESEMRQLTVKVKNDYKKAKQQHKQEEAQKRASVTSNQLRDQYAQLQQQEEVRKQQEHKYTLNEELRKFRRDQLMMRQNLEKSLLIEEMNTLQAQKDQAHEMLLRHHQCTQELEYKQLSAMHRLRGEQQKNLHDTEWDNQMEYNKKAETELQKKHLLEIRQRPKTLKAQEIKVKKQFHDTLKIQNRQYKLLQKQMLANTPREKHQEIMKKFKEDQVRKVADLASQYEISINDLMQKQKVRLDEIQLTELEALRNQLEQEQEVLRTYQARQSSHLASHIEKEIHELEERVKLRKSLLEERMFEESTRLQDIRLERLRDLQARHQHELTEFDKLSQGYKNPDQNMRNSRLYASGGAGGAFNQGSPRNSGRSFGTPSGDHSRPSRESSTSMSSLQSHGGSRMNSQSSMSASSIQDRRSFHERGPPLSKR